MEEEPSHKWPTMLLNATEQTYQLFLNDCSKVCSAVKSLRFAHNSYYRLGQLFVHWLNTKANHGPILRSVSKTFLTTLLSDHCPCHMGLKDLGL